MIGVLGGMGPLATADFFNKVIKFFPYGSGRFRCLCVINQIHIGRILTRV